MKRINKKLFTIALVVLLFIGSGAAVLSYLRAKAEDADDLPPTQPTGSTIKTNIDIIIDKSNGEDDANTPEFDETVYHIVEISSGAQSTFGGFSLKSGESDIQGFRNLVINEHKTSSQPDLMKAGKVDFKFFSVNNMAKGSSDETDALKAIVNADLIYLSCDVTDDTTIYSTANNRDFTEDMKTALITYAVTSKKPIIVDSPTKSNGIINGTLHTFSDIGSEFYEDGSIRNAFVWNKLADGSYNDPMDYFQRGNDSLFLNIVQKNVIDNWYYSVTINGDGDVVKTKGINTGDEERVAKILTITANSATPATPLTDMINTTLIKDANDDPFTIKIPNGTLQQRMGTDGKPVVDAGGNDVYDVVDAAGNVITADTTKEIKVYGIDENSAFYNAYKFGYIHPDYVEETVVKYDKSATDATNMVGTLTSLGIDANAYDMIVIEPSVKGLPISDGSSDVADPADPSKSIPDDDFTMLISAMYGLRHFVYAEDIVPASGSGSYEFPATNFMDVYNQIVGKKDKPKYGSVLVCSKTMMDAYTSTNADRNTVQPIVDIINNGAYRTSGGTDGESTNKFTVLEIQPAAPIDLNLFSQMKGFYKNSHETGIMPGYMTDAGSYYFSPFHWQDMNKTTDEISYNGTKSVSLMKNADGSFNDTAGISTTNADFLDYYAWELSDAKVLHIINQVPAFSEYKISDVKVVHMSAEEFQSSRVSLLDNYDLIYIGGNNSAIKDPERFFARTVATNATYYTMYYHNGDLYNYPANIYGSGEGEVGVMMGNDFTYDKLQELYEFVDSGMPVVFSSSVSEAYEEMAASNTPYKLHKIDPDSNMRKFIDYTYVWDENGNRGETKSNILRNFNPMSTVLVDNEYNGEANYYTRSGFSVYSGKVTVVDETNEALIVAKINNSNSRPKFKIIPTVKAYNEYDKDGTAITATSVRFEWDMSASTEAVRKNTVFNLFIDDNNDGKFKEEDKELVYANKPGTDGWLVFDEFADDFFGPVYFQLQAVYTNPTTNVQTKASYRILCRIKPPYAKKSTINILQLIPEGSAQGDDNNKSMQTLMFCIDCQQGSVLFKGNRSVNQGKFTHDAIEGISNGYKDRNPNGTGLDNSYSTIGNNIAAYDATDKVDTSAASLETTYSYEGNILGVHKHRFGIVKYDSTLTIDNKTGVDDYRYNWADDYDFNTTILDTRTYEKWCSDIMTIYRNSSQDLETTRSEYADQAARFEKYYQFITMLLNDSSSLYVPYSMSQYRKQAQNLATMTPDEINNLRNQIKNEFQRDMGTAQYNASDIRSIDSVTTLISRYNAYLGISDADYDTFETQLKDYDLVPQDHERFEAEMHNLKATDKDIVSYAKSQNALDAHCDVLSAGFANGSINSDKGTAEQNSTEVLAWKRYHNYFEFYSLCSDGNYSNKLGAEATTFARLYEPWRNAMIYERYFYNKYLEARKFASVDDDGKIDFNQTFSIVIVGPAEKFGNDDILPDSVTGEQYACDALKSYADAGGKLLLFHDTLTKGDTGYGENMTDQLRQYFGQNARPIEEKVDKSNIALVNNRKLTFTIGGSSATPNTEVASSDDDVEFIFDATINPLPNNAKIYVYMLSDAPGNGDILISNYKTKCLGPYNTSTDSISYSAVTKPQNGFQQSNIVRENLKTTNNGGSALNLTFNISGVDYNNNPESRTSYAVIYFGDLSDATWNNGNQYLPKDKCEVVKIGNEEVKHSTVKGVPNLSWASSVRSGSISGETDDGQTVKFSIKGNYESMIGSTVSLYDPESKKTYNSVLKRGTDHNGNDAAVAEFGIQNWKALGNAKTYYGADASVGYNDDKYFLSTLAQDGTNNIGKTVNLTTINDRVIMYTSQDDASRRGNLMYRFATYDKQPESTTEPWKHKFDQSKNRHTQNTDYATQNNSGRVTMYPFNIPENIKITGTHPQAFNLDLENEDMTVYYSLAGGEEGTYSLLFAASPKDGSDNYFVYQYKNVTFCGAGHSVVTGYGTDNNDERRLLINIICNSLTKSAIGTQLKLYDADATDGTISKGLANKKVKNDGAGQYTYTVSELTETPAFSYVVNADQESGVIITRVQAYYDLDYQNLGTFHDFEGDPDADGKDKTGNHILIYDTGVSTSDAGWPNREIGRVNNDSQFIVGRKTVNGAITSNLQLKPEYFDPYGGSYTYIIVHVQTKRKDKTFDTYKRIKIITKPSLFDLT